MLSERSFIKGGGLALIGVGIVGSIPAFAIRAALSQKKQFAYKKTKTLVCIFQRGAMDGLMAITPFTDANLQTARPNLFMSAAANSPNGNAPLIDLDGRFGSVSHAEKFRTLLPQRTTRYRARNRIAE